MNHFSIDQTGAPSGHRSADSPTGGDKAPTAGTRASGGRLIWPFLVGAKRAPASALSEEDERDGPPSFSS